MMTYGDTIRFMATKPASDSPEETKTDKAEPADRRQFILKRSGSANTDGYKLYGYDGDANGKNILEDFGIPNDSSINIITSEAKSLIKFYCPPEDGWNINRHSMDLS